MTNPCCLKMVDPKQAMAFIGPGRIDLSTRPMIAEYVRRYQPESCEYNFINLFCWDRIYQFQWFIWEDCLVIYDPVSRSMIMPLGPTLEPSSLIGLSRTFMDMGLSPRIALVPEDYIRAWPEIETHYSVSQDRDAAEYIYLTEKLVALTGTKLHKKRNLISQFKRKYPDHRVVPIRRAELADVRGFAGGLLNAMESLPRSLADEFSAMEKAFDHWDVLGLQGLLLLVGEQIAGFSVFSPLNQDTYNVHFEKTSLAFKGSAQVINRETAKALVGKARYINREQDLGIPGLRRGKLSYAPHRLWMPYTLDIKADAFVN